MTFTAVLFSLAVSLAGPEIIHMSDFGLTASSCDNAVVKIQRAFDYGKKLGKPFEIRFEKGSYYLDIGDPMGTEASINNYVFKIEDCNDVVIDGGGSEFVFKGIAGFAVMLRSNNIELRNFSIDWKRPYITQAVVRSCGDGWMDIEIDKNQYPYRITGKQVFYICGDGKYTVAQNAFCNYLTPQGRILPGSYDNYWMGALLNGPAEEISEGVIRFHGKVEVPAPEGTILTIYHVLYRTSWASITDCKDIVLRDITVNHTTGCGVVATIVNNLVIDNVDYIPRRDKGRVFSAVDDAFHLTNCSGRVIMRNCDIDGQGDDALNVHGRYCKVMGILSGGRTLRFGTTHGILLLRPGEKIWFINKETMLRSSEYTVEASRALNASLFEVTLTEIPDIDTNQEWFIESASACPDVLIENNVFGSGNRARGILLTSPGKVVVRNNLFKSSGAAILVEGDLTYWYESGGVRDLTITGNVFDCCHTSQWGHSVISFSPSPVPEDDSLPRFHKGIRITGNTFRLIEPSVLYARFVGDMIFSDNDISVVGGYPALGNMQQPIVLEHCNDCITENNFKTGSEY